MGLLKVALEINMKKAPEKSGAFFISWCRWEHRLNLKNYCREFFAVPFANIEKAVKTRFPNAEIVLDAEAQDYYESIVLREQYAESHKIEEPESFPTELV